MFSLKEIGAAGLLVCGVYWLLKRRVRVGVRGGPWLTTLEGLPAIAVALAAIVAGGLILWNAWPNR